MAPALGFEPRTKWLTATYSTAELCRNNKMAEREGFEPSERFPPRRFSKPVLSATQPSLRLADDIRYHPIWIFQAVFQIYCKKNSLFVEFFSNPDCLIPNLTATYNFWYRRWDLNPHSQREPDFESSASAISPLRHFQDKKMERVTGFEPATITLAT